jgi:plastocyanin
MAWRFSRQDLLERKELVGMRKLVLVPIAALLLLVAPAASAASATVQITRSGFSPGSLTVSVGDTVTWHNADTLNHQVVANDGSFASSVLKPGQTYAVTFPTAKTIHYHDALHTSLKGTVTVRAPAAVLTLSAADQTVVFGDSTTLSGTLSTKLAGQSVALLSQPAGAKTAQQENVVTTDANGAYSFTVSPTIQTVYRTQWKTTTSPAVTISVAPHVGFGLKGRIYSTRVTSDISYGGHFVYVQRRVAPFVWRNVKKLVLSQAFSRARFTMRLPRGRSVLRVWLPSSQAGAGYVQSISAAMAVVRR